MDYLTIFVANVNFDDDGRLKVNVNRLSNDNVWNASNHHRVVVPETHYFSPIYYRGVFVVGNLFWINFLHPPRCLPISCIFSARIRYSFCGTRRFSYAIWRKKERVSSLVIACSTSSCFFSVEVNTA